MGFTANTWGSPGYGGSEGGGGSVVDSAPVVITAFSNGWTAAEPVTYQRKISGNVEIFGVIIPGTLTNGTAIFTLPTGRRPVINEDFMVEFGTSFMIRITAATGVVSVLSKVGTPTYGILDDIEFSAV